MDFKSLISKIDSIETPREPAARLETPKRVQLDEETSIKFLAGTTTLKEAAEIMEKKLTKAEKEKKEEVVKSMKKDKSDFKKRYGEKGEEVMHATATKIAKKKAEGVEINNAVISELDMNLIKAAQKGQEGKPVSKPDAESDKNVRKKYGYRMDGEPAERDDDETKQDRRGRKRQNTGENVELDREKFKLKFFSLVEAKKKEAAKTVKGKKAEEKMDEGKKKKPDADNDGVPDWADKKPGEDDNVGKKDGKKGMTAKQAKYFGKKKTNESQVDEFFYFDEPDSRSKKDRDHGEDELARREKKGIKATDPDYKQKDDPRYGGRYKVAGPKGKLPESQRGSKKTVKESVFENYSPRKRVATVGQLEITDWLRKSAGLPKDAPVYFDDADLVWGDQTIVGGALASEELTLGDLLKAFKAAVAKYPTGWWDTQESKFESKHKSKKMFKESLEPKMSFRDMMKLVVESGGQQQIDPLDKALFAWATRVAQQKFSEGMKSEVYAGLVYERMGGRFDMYDVLSEDRLDENWKKKLGAAAMAGIMGLGAMGGASAADMPGKDIGSDKPVAQVNAYKSMLEVEREVQDLAKVDKQAAKSYEATKSYYNKLLGKAKSPEDMKEIDKEYTKSLQTIIKLSTNLTPGGG
jgi:hypothetical protein